MSKLREWLRPRPFKNLNAEQLRVAIDASESCVAIALKNNRPLIANAECESLYYLREELERKTHAKQTTVA